MSILANAGKTRLYNTNGTGRDTYITFNSGGNTVGNFPTLSLKAGNQFNKAIVGIRKPSGSPGKTMHYQVDGTGRDSYIHCSDGGFTNYFSAVNS